jgi:hypothetical protein
MKTIISDLKNDYFCSATDDISFNLIKSTLQSNNSKERIHYLNLILNF